MTAMLSLLLLAAPADAAVVGRDFFAAAIAGDKDRLEPLLHARFRFIIPDRTQDRTAFLADLGPHPLPPTELTVEVQGPVALVVRPVPNTGQFDSRFLLLLARFGDRWQAIVLSQVSTWAGPGESEEVDLEQLRAVADQLRALARRALDARAEGGDRILALARPSGVIVLSSDDGPRVAPADDPELPDALLETAAEPLEAAEPEERYGFFVGYAARPVERTIDGESRPGWQLVLVGLDHQAETWRVLLYVEVDTPRPTAG